MHLKTLSDWMRAPGGGILDTELFAVQQQLSALDLKFVALRRERQFNDLMRQLEEAERTGKTHKRWISERRPTSRRSHHHAHNQVAPIRGYFQVGDERLFLPGDPNASWEETANCECTVVFERRVESQVTLASQIDEYIRITLFGVSDTGTAWNDGDFVSHYVNGRGRAVSVRQTGHLKSIVDRYRKNVIDDPKRLPTEIANKAREIKNGSFSDDFYNTYDMEDIIFSIGDTTIGGKFSGRSSEKNDILTISGAINFYLKDEFKDPLDRYDLIPGSFELPFGKVYPITDNWKGKFKGFIYLDQNNSKFK